MIRFSWEEADCLVCTTSKFHELVTPFPMEWFHKREIAYEDMTAIIPSQAEKYCEAMYGDYMTLPPQDQRVVRRHVAKIDLDHPYTDYKGTVYCITNSSYKQK